MKNQTFSEVFKKLLRQRKLRQKDLAAYLGTEGFDVSKHTFSKWVNGREDWPEMCLDLVIERLDQVKKPLTDEEKQTLRDLAQQRVAGLSSDPAPTPP